MITTALEEANRFVSAIYRGILRREPDPAGLKFYADALQAGRSPASITEELISCDEFKAQNAVKLFVRDPRLEVRQRMHEIVRTRIRYGCRRIHIMLKRDGWAIGRNVVYRLYREECLALRSKRSRRRKMVVHREAQFHPKHLNEACSLDFIHDQLSHDEKFRALTVVDVFSRRALAIEVGQRLRGEHVVEVLNRLVRAWRIDYNTIRPHSALNYRPPAPQTFAPLAAHLDKIMPMQ